jgi:hypothetical protein
MTWAAGWLRPPTYGSALIQGNKEFTQSKLRNDQLPEKVQGRYDY